MNPAVLTAFALAIAADGQGPAYPGIPGHEPLVAAGQASRRAHRSMHASASCDLCPDAGSYVSESNYFESGWQRCILGKQLSAPCSNQKKYDPDGLFFVHHGVGSENGAPTASRGYEPGVEKKRRRE